MRLSRKAIVRIVVVFIALLLLYCLHASGAHRWTDKTVNESVTTVGPLGGPPSNAQPRLTIVEDHQELYNVWCIFTKVASNSPMRTKFRIFVESLLRTSNASIGFHVISDNESKIVADKVVGYVMTVTGKNINVRVE